MRTSNNFGRYSAPTRVTTGLGALATLDSELAGMPGPSAVVADRGVAAAGLLSQILDQVDQSRLGPVILIDPNPDVSTVNEAVHQAKAANCRSVLAIGGGSGLCAAKGVAIGLTNEGSVADYEGAGNVPLAAAPTIAVPTTAGSGSEVSNALVLHEPGRAREIVVRGPGCEPRLAILDATVLRGLPWAPMLYAGLDALSHALEALWVRGATSFTDGLAIHAAHQIFRTLPRALAGSRNGANATGANDALLQELLEASTAANLACGSSGLGLVHALSSSVQVLLPHGQQNGVLLPRVALLNRPSVSAATVALIDQIPWLYNEIGFQDTFDPQVVGAGELHSMVTASCGHPFRLNNRTEVTDDQLVDLLAGTVARNRKDVLQ
ncbi:iron-containing alcohol dehydrogenase [Mycobacteroides abscessus]|uniref:iron-containing alcohol dehydrogenase n=1 Tax=Mycobacteroides abscessus TaxID=36809 RepID=UPI0009A8B0C5|nr:iron-containing alcohol dehydrogenase [Mycobacteroides abscessus]RIT40859.1 iron-containing alcohol dehydrogenase [Mycobacteroides abscessus]SKT94347.1 alcohol dehydrogenase, class IV [Mycobacteroides abscessus subsp. massiliense]SKU20349.1 alcohol dehydrogenase, class IV [Mycobacteroides abscessus subsp. massiliense]